MVMIIQDILKVLKEQLEPYSDTGLLDAQVVVSHHLGKPRTWVLAHQEDLLSEGQYQQVLHSTERLKDGEPLPYVLGHWEFYGLDFLVTPDVLIPRPETELLVESAIHWLQNHPHIRTVVDVGTGSGCIGIAIARHVPDLQVVLVDRYARALRIARRNMEKHGLQDRVEVVQSDLLLNIPGIFGLICANLPYIPKQTLEKLPVAKREPRSALDGGISGINLIRRLLKQAKGRLHSGGLVLIEIDPTQKDVLLESVRQAYSTSRIQVLQDLAGRDRCLMIELPHTILHVCPRQAWVNCQAIGEYRADSLVLDGFIHCSLPEQITEVMNRFYQGTTDLVALQINPEKLNSEVRWEKSGDALFPHIYGPINLQAVDKVTSIQADSDGFYRHIL